MKDANMDAGQALQVACVTRPVDQDDPRAGEVFELRARQYAGFLADIVLRDPAPQVLMAMNDVSLLLVARALRILGRVPGRDIAVVGYDNFWPQSKDRRFEPYVPLATVDKHNDMIGQRLAELLLARLAGELPREPQSVLVEPRLVVTDEQVTNQQ
jgi:DNA-binding LacI/PurR family transcriptional regulator